MGYQVKSRRITRELDKEPSLHYSSIYTTILWSVLKQCVYLMSIHHASTSCPISYPHVFSLRPPCFLYVPWRHIFNLHYTCIHHVYTMRNPCPLMSSLTLTPSRLFPILLDPKSFQTILASVIWLPGHVPISYSFICCRLIIIILIYVRLTLTLAKVCPHSHLITPVRKLHSHGETTSKSYKPIFYSSHLSCNTSYGGAATL